MGFNTRTTGVRMCILLLLPSLLFVPFHAVNPLPRHRHLNLLLLIQSTKVVGPSCCKRHKKWGEDREHQTQPKSSAIRG
uniref:Putative secreted protein n=1 Tax=Anopheles darlingi TaxID=43151 RepID=A0A2M4DA78_ANODA